jgi:hypothetical protein
MAIRHIFGVNKKIIDDEFRVATDCMLGLLIPDKKVLKKVKIDLTFETDASRPNLTAYVDTYIDAKDKMEYLMYIRPTQSRKNQLTSLAHELVHVKQYSYGELTICSEGITPQWNGMPFGETVYWDQPWEIEARGREHGLLVRYADFLSERNKKIIKNRKK